MTSTVIPFPGTMSPRGDTVVVADLLLRNQIGRLEALLLKEIGEFLEPTNRNRNLVSSISCTAHVLGMLMSCE
jgi:hypothetical protein